MKRLLSFLCVTMALYGCTNSISGTSWLSLNRDGDTVEMSFSDSTCVIIAKSAIGKPDTIHAKYKMHSDTIIFLKPKENFAINLKVYLKGDKLFLVDSHELAFNNIKN